MASSIKAQVYFLPGLGFDHRIYDKLSLENVETHFLDWIVPEKNEDLRSYAHRMSESIKSDLKPIILVGHSFGGIVCQEIAREIKVDAVVLISSIKERNELPIILKLSAKVGFHKVLSRQLILNSFPIWARSFGYENEEQRSLFRKMVGQQSNTFLRWAMEKISNWNGSSFSDTPLFHIHGTRDRTFPPNLLSGNIDWVDKGNHFMVFKKPDEISIRLQKIIDGLTK